MRGGRTLNGALVAALIAAGSVTASGAVTSPTSAAASVEVAGDGQAPAGVGAHTWTTEAVTFDVMTGPDSDIAVTIEADLWKPDDASAANPMPAIVHQHGFGGNKSNAEQLTNAAYFASHGYVVVTISTQGFGQSTGCIALDSIDYDGRNTMAIIDWLATQDFVALDEAGDPKVGLMGGSYGGGHQGLVGVVDDRVDAIAPGRTWHTLQHSLVPNNYFDPAAPWDLDAADQGVFKQGWTSLFFALGAAQPAQGNGGCDPVARQATYPTAEPCAGFIPGVCAINAQLSALGTSDQAGRDLIKTASLATRIGELRVPTIISQGLPDTLFVTNETVPTLLSLQQREIPVAVFWISSGHGVYLPADGDGEPYGGTFNDTPELQELFADTYWARRHLSWFERHVRGDASVDTGPGFAWFRPWVSYDIAITGGTAAPAYGTSPSYPPVQAEPLVFTLDPSTQLLAAPGLPIEGGTSSFINPQGGEPAAYSETANFSSPGQPGDQPATEIEGQHVVFTTAPFDESLVVVGVPELNVHLSHRNTAGDAIVFAKLYDVAPDGTATLIRRQVAPARIGNNALDAGAVDIHLIGTSWRFEAGHAARLVLAATDQAYYNNKLADQLTVDSTPDAPSTLTLPVISAAADVGGETLAAGGTDPDQTGDAGGALAATGGGVAIVALVVLGLAFAIRPRRGPEEAPTTRE
jgi:putative CocE/NonD family hydrolase